MEYKYKIDNEQIKKGFSIIMETSFKPVFKPENGDYYGSDGLMYCGKCRERKQQRVEVLGGEYFPRINCRCQDEEMRLEDEKIEAAKKFAEYADRIKNRSVLYANFNDKELRNAKFENDDMKNPYISNIAKNYVNNFEEMKLKGKGLLFFGKPGVGKSYISACIANALVDRGCTVMMTSFLRLINIIGGMFEGKQEFIDEIVRYDLLIIDDLFAERQNEYANEIVQNVIDSRSRTGLPTIFSTNLTSAELKKPSIKYQERILSRLYKMCQFVEYKGEDRRRSAMAQDDEYMKNLLGI